MTRTVEIRLELLKKIGEGYSKRETVKWLKDKFGITESGAYYHFASRDKWLGQYSAFDREFAFQVKQRFNYIYREASFQYLHAKEDNAKIGYLRTMLEANRQCAEYLPKDLDVNPEVINVKWQQSIKNSLQREEKWRSWLEENCSPEERRLTEDFKRLWIRYQYATNPKLREEGESIH